MNATSDKSGEPGLERPVTGVGFTHRRRFLNACWCQPVDRPPVWLMRQAGRALPEYRKLKESHTFLELVQNPELAVEVTLQPIRRFGFDAAILFSDILVIPEAMGQPYRFRDTGGVVMDFDVRTKADIARLSVEQVTEKLGYVDRALRLLRRELGDGTALIGFAGSPWTLATFMMEGGSAKEYRRALSFFREDRQAYFILAEKLTDAIARYLRMQIDAGVDAVQIFDSHGGQLASTEFQEASGRWMREIVTRVGAPASGPAASAKGINCAGSETGAPSTPAHPPARSEIAPCRPLAPPVIVFSLGTHGNWEDLTGTGANVLGIDWQFPLAEVRRRVPAHVALQGNLAPALLSEGSPADVARETTRLLLEMRGRPGYIFNLGHGLPPTSKLENISALVETVKNHQ
jgi:uroporphyrinogen decarboxylase